MKRLRRWWRLRQTETWVRYHVGWRRVRGDLNPRPPLGKGW